MSHNERKPGVPRPDSVSGAPKRWVVIGIGAAMAVMAVGAVAFVVAGDGDVDDSASESSGEIAEFEPYTGGDAPADNSPAPDEQSDFDTEDAESASNDSDQQDSAEEDGPGLLEQMDEAGYAREDELRPQEENILGQEPDGERIIEDRRGEPISQRRAQERLEKEIESVEQADREFERRLRRRDMNLNSQVLRPRSGEAPAPVPGVEINEQLQERIQEQFENKNRE